MWLLLFSVGFLGFTVAIGALLWSFIKKNKDICDNCIKEIQNLQESIIEYVDASPLEKVHVYSSHLQQAVAV